jgi:hypothetical protein
MSLSGNVPKREYGASASCCALDILLLKPQRAYPSTAFASSLACDDMETSGRRKLPARDDTVGIRRSTRARARARIQNRRRGGCALTQARAGANRSSPAAAIPAGMRTEALQLAGRCATSQRTACTMQHTTCNMQHTPCNMQHTTCNMPCSMQHRAYDRPQCNIHAAACVACTLPLRPFGRAPTPQQRHGQQSTSALGLGSPPPCLDRDWASPCHICTGVG